jgi:hypothetical protein
MADAKNGDAAFRGKWGKMKTSREERKMKNSTWKRLLTALMAMLLLLSLIGCSKDEPARPRDDDDTSDSPKDDKVETASQTIGLMTLEHDKQLVVEWFSGNTNLVLSTQGVDAQNNRYVVDITYTSPNQDTLLLQSATNDELGDVLRDVIEAALTDPEFEDDWSTETVAGERTVSLVGESQEDKKKIKTVICFDDEDGMYLVSYITQPNSFDRYLSVFSDILKSIKFKAPDTPPPPTDTPTIPPPTDTPPTGNTFTIGTLSAEYNDVFNVAADNASAQLTYGETLIMVFQYVQVPGVSLLSSAQLAEQMKVGLRAQFPIDDPTTIVVKDTELNGVMERIGGHEWAVYEAEFEYSGTPMGVKSYATADGDDFYIIMVAMNGGLGISEAQYANAVLATVRFGATGGPSTGLPPAAGGDLAAVLDAANKKALNHSNPVVRKIAEVGSTPGVKFTDAQSAFGGTGVVDDSYTTLTFTIWTVDGIEVSGAFYKDTGAIYYVKNNWNYKPYADSSIKFVADLENKVDELDELYDDVDSGVPIGEVLALCGGADPTAAGYYADGPSDLVWCDGTQYVFASVYWSWEGEPQILGVYYGRIWS